MSEELNQNRLNTKRTTQVRRDNDTVQDVSIGLYDIDETIKYYFDNIINLLIQGIIIEIGMIDLILLTTYKVEKRSNNYRKL